MRYIKALILVPFFIIGVNCYAQNATDPGTPTYIDLSIILDSLNRQQIREFLNKKHFTLSKSTFREDSFRDSINDRDILISYVNDKSRFVEIMTGQPQDYKLYRSYAENFFSPFSNSRLGEFSTSSWYNKKYYLRPIIQDQGSKRKYLIHLLNREVSTQIKIEN